MREIDKQKFGAFVAQLRKEAGCTQKQLAEQLCISDKAVSKWETGVSLPDTAMLIPLSEFFGVTVTELLMGTRLSEQQPLEPEEVETLVQTVISCPVPKAWQEKSHWKLWYLLSLIICGSAWLTGLEANPGAVTCTILGVVFGAYFCLLASMKLPDFYDQNRLGMVQDGVFRINVPGLRFNNSNWPHIVKGGRIWACLNLILLPWLARIMEQISPAWWLRMEAGILTALLTVSLLGMLYGIGKKYE